MNKKTNSDLVEAIFLAKKNNLLEIAQALSRPSKKQAKVNLQDLDKIKKEVVIVPGKVLSKGEVNKKIKIYALGYSENARKKLKNKNCECRTIIEGLRENKKLTGEIVG